MILSVDIGGTKIAVSLWERGENRPELRKKLVFSTENISDLGALLDQILPEHSVSSAVFAVAGVTSGRYISLTNAGLIIDKEDISKRFKNKSSVHFINDAQALAHAVDNGVPILSPPLKTGKQPEGDAVKSVISLGTGLGISHIARHGTIIPSEGGHMSLVPYDELTEGLSAFLADKYRSQSDGHVSYERALSGMGIANIYSYLSGKESDKLPGDISAAALQNMHLPKDSSDYDRFATLTFEVFSRLLGHFAGELSICTMPLGGIYIGGGIPLKILPLIDGKLFSEAFVQKGRCKGFLSDISAHIISDSDAVLYGTACVGL